MTTENVIYSLHGHRGDFSNYVIPGAGDIPQVFILSKKPCETLLNTPRVLTDLLIYFGEETFMLPN